MKLSIRIAFAAALVAAGMIAETTNAGEAVIVVSPVGSVGHAQGRF